MMQDNRILRASHSKVNFQECANRKYSHTKVIKFGCFVSVYTIRRYYTLRLIARTFVRRRHGSRYGYPVSDTVQCPSQYWSNTKALSSHATLPTVTQS